MRAYLLSAAVIGALTLSTPSDAKAQVILQPSINTSPYAYPANYYSYSPGYVYPAAYSLPAYPYNYGYTYPAGYTYPVSTWGYSTYSYPTYYRGYRGWRRW